MWKDLPSRHNIEVHVHNEFVKWLKVLKTAIIVSNEFFVHIVVLTFIHRKPLGGSQQLQMGGQRTTRKAHFWG